jgi:hypothetical protein
MRRQGRWAIRWCGVMRRWGRGSMRWRGIRRGRQAMMGWWSRATRWCGIKRRRGCGRTRQHGIKRRRGRRATANEWEVADAKVDK